MNTPQFVNKTRRLWLSSRASSAPSKPQGIKAPQPRQSLHPGCENATLPKRLLLRSPQLISEINRRVRLVGETLSDDDRSLPLSVLFSSQSSLLQRLCSRPPCSGENTWFSCVDSTMDRQKKLQVSLFTLAYVTAM